MEREPTGEDQRSGEYLTNSGIVNYAMQISERHAASAIQRGSLRLLYSGPQLLSLLFQMYNALPALYE